MTGPRHTWKIQGSPDAPTSDDVGGGVVADASSRGSERPRAAETHPHDVPSADSIVERMLEASNLDDRPLDDDFFIDAPLTEDTTQPSGIVLEAAGSKWKVLIVDDDDDIRSISTLALDDLVVDGRGVDLVCLANAASAREYLREDPEVAVAVVDVVMESETAGLDFIRWVREVHGDRRVRLIVRTGQPGMAPEETVMSDYDIHDYLSKSETTARRLSSSITSGIRAWRDLVAIHRQYDGLDSVLRGIESLFTVQDADALLKVVLEHFTRNLSGDGCGGIVVGPPAMGLGDDTEPRVLASCGNRAPGAGLLVRDLQLEPPIELDPERIPRGRKDGRLAVVFDVAPTYRPILVCLANADTAWTERIVRIFQDATTLALRNQLTWQRAINRISGVLAEREVLLKEIHHRVKNNLQIISGLLSMQAAKVDLPEARAALVDSELRVKTIALVHQLLYDSSDFLHVDFSTIIQTLVTQLAAALAPDAECAISVDRVDLAIDQAMPVCLILNELLTNALKHGRSKDERLRVSVRVVLEDDLLTLSVNDDGAGVKDDLATLRRKSLGLRIVDALTKQLKGKFELRVQQGTCFSLTFPVVKPDATPA